MFDKMIRQCQYNPIFWLGFASVKVCYVDAWCHANWYKKRKPPLELVTFLTGSQSLIIHPCTQDLWPIIWSRTAWFYMLLKWLLLVYPFQMEQMLIGCLCSFHWDKRKEKIKNLVLNMYNVNVMPTGKSLSNYVKKYACFLHYLHVV